jgi:hypothetical protein
MSGEASQVPDGGDTVGAADASGTEAADHTQSTPAG